MLPVSSQKLSLSTNFLDYLSLGTMNIEASCSVSRQWSLTAAACYNPFTYRKGDPERQFQRRQLSFAAGARLWPWHTMSGWWFAGKLRYQEYNSGGLVSRLTREGDRCGVEICAGYTHMLSRHFNIEFGAGIWTGMDWYTMYSCPVCGLTEQSGRKGFVAPEDLMISIVYVF